MGTPDPAVDASVESAPEARRQGLRLILEMTAASRGRLC